jgi:hypothetical protein
MTEQSARDSPSAESRSGVGKGVTGQTDGEVAIIDCPDRLPDSLADRPADHPDDHPHLLTEH